MSKRERPPGGYNPQQQAAAILDLAAGQRQRVAAETDPALRSEGKEVHYWIIKAARGANKDIADGGVWQAAISAGSTQQQDAPWQETQKKIFRQ